MNEARESVCLPIDEITSVSLILYGNKLKIDQFL